MATGLRVELLAAMLADEHDQDADRSYVPFGGIPSDEGLEFTAPVNRLHFRVEGGRMHYRARDGRMHYCMGREG